MFYFYNYGYMIGSVLVMLASLLCIYAQSKVTTTYARYKKIPSAINRTGAMVAREILNSEGLYDIEVGEVSGQLSDHYHPTKKIINLSSEIYHGTSLAALSVAAHECGHAIQYKHKYFPITMRNMILPFANAGQYLGWIAIMLGLLLGHTNIAWIGFVMMCGILVFQIVTLPVEFDASSRALNILRTRYLREEEFTGAKRMLSAAAFTYVASMLATLMSMLRIFLMIASSRRRD